MSDPWANSWSAIRNDPAPIPIPIGAMSPPQMASPKSESFGGSSLCRQVAENILCGSPATPKPPDYFKPPENYITAKPDGIPFTPGMVAIRGAGDTTMILPGTPGTPEFQPFLSTMVASAGPPSWNAVFTNAKCNRAPPGGAMAVPLSPAPDPATAVFSTTPPYGNLNIPASAAASQLTGITQTLQALMVNPQTQQAAVAALTQALGGQPQLYMLQQQQAAAQMTNPGFFQFAGLAGVNPQQLQTLQQNLNMNAAQAQQQQLNLNTLNMSQLRLSQQVPSVSNNVFPLSPAALRASRGFAQHAHASAQIRSEFGSVAAPSRSSLLEDFRNNRSPSLQLSDLGDHVVEFAQDQHGSRFIQQKLERATPSDKEVVYQHILKNAVPLMTDVFGNYVIQKFFEHGTTDQRVGLCKAIKGHVMSLTQQMYGCRVIQKALEAVDEPLQMEILKEMEGQVLRCVKDQNGNHVVQKVIEKVKPEKLQFIIDAFVNEHENNVFTLSTHPYGCRVIQRVLEYCNDDQKRPILVQLHLRLEELVIDQYGNYVIQHVIEHGSESDRDFIINAIAGKVLAFSQHKFSSNVIEKILLCAQPRHKNRLIAEVCGEPNDPNPPLMQMMKDQYANYVVQKMLDVADAQHRKKMLFAIKPHIPQLRKFNYGKHIITKLEKYFSKAGIMPTAPPPPPQMPLHHHPMMHPTF